MQLLALARQDGGVDGFREERMPEAKAAGRLLGDEHGVFHGLPQQLAQLGLGESRGLAEERVRHLAPGHSGQTQDALRRTVETSHALQKQIAEAVRQLLLRRRLRT